MIQITTFIKVGNELVSIEKVNDRDIDTRRIEGSIELKINNETIIEKNLWDDVDDLWTYLTNGLADLQEKGFFKTKYPDQPIKISFERKQNQVEVCLEWITKKRGTTSYSQFVRAIRGAALLFFNRIKVIDQHRDFCLDNIQYLEKIK